MALTCRDDSPNENVEKIKTKQAVIRGQIIKRRKGIKVVSENKMPKAIKVN